MAKPKLKKFRVWVQENNYGFYDVEAESAEEATEMYYEGEFPDNFRHKGGENTVEEVVELNEDGDPKEK